MGIFFFFFFFLEYLKLFDKKLFFVSKGFEFFKNILFTKKKVERQKLKVAHV